LSAAFISVAAIMPQAVGSGKQQRDAAVMRSLCSGTFSAKRNGPKVGGATGTETCYIPGVSKPKQPRTKVKKKGFVIGRASFGKISAVEGIRLTPAMKKRAADAQRRGLSAEEYRQAIMRSYRKA